MKKIQILNRFKAFSLFGIAICISAGFVQSQNRYEIASVQTGFVGSTALKPENPRLNEIHAGAIRHFLRNFPEAGNGQWQKSGNGYQVKFMERGQECQAMYSERGIFQYAVRFFDESVLHPYILKKIRKDFPEYETDIVAEVVTENKKQFLVTLKNSRSMKSLVIDQQSISIIDDLEYILQ